MFRKAVSHFEEIISVCLLVILLIVLFIQVFTRFVLNDPATWTEEGSRLIFIYLALFGASAAVRTRSHVRIEFFVDKMPYRGQVMTSILLNVVCIAALCLLAYLGYQTVLRQHMLSMVSLPLPNSVFYAGFPLAMVLMAVRLFVVIKEDASLLSRNEESSVSQTQKPRI